MADTLLHITLARQIIGDPRLDTAAADLLRRYPSALDLGAVAFDLPFYDDLFSSARNKLSGRPQSWSPVGTSIHERRCGALCADAVGASTDESRFAVAAGMLSHFAADIAFHLEIERRVREDGIVHEVLENDIGILCHCDRLGHPGVGSAFCRDALSITPPCGWAEDFAILLQRTADIRVSAAYLKKCLRSLRLFGYLHSIPAPWVKTRADVHPSIEHLALSLCDESIASGIALINDAYKVFCGRLSLPAFTAGLPARRMKDGAPE